MKVKELYEFLKDCDPDAHIGCVFQEENILDDWVNVVNIVKVQSSNTNEQQVIIVFD